MADLGNGSIQPDGNLRGAEGRGVDLALGDGAVLPAHRQAAAAEGVGDRGAVPCAALLDLSTGCGGVAAEPADHPVAAGGGDAAGDNDQGSWPGRVAAEPHGPGHSVRQHIRCAVSGCL